MRGSTSDVCLSKEECNLATTLVPYKLHQFKNTK